MLLATIPANQVGTITLDYCPERLLLTNSLLSADMDDAFDDAGTISISHSGRQTVNIGAGRVKPAANLKVLGSRVGWLQLGLGRKNGSTTMQIQNLSATLPMYVYGASSGFSPVLYGYSETSINSNANQTFIGFDALIFDDSSVIERVQIKFSNGFVEDFSALELQSLLAVVQNTDSDGELTNKTILLGLGIQEATVFANASNSLIVTSRNPITL